MIEWLKRDPRRAPSITIGGKDLPVIVRRLANARRMTLRLAPDGSEIRISIPRWGRTEDALAFASSRTDWLERQYTALPDCGPVTPGQSFAYRGAQILIEHDVDAPRSPVLGENNVRLGGPLESLAARLRRWLQARAREALADDLSHYCALAGREVPRLALSNAQRRWGSCAPNGTIRINWRLIMAPDSVRRSVVAHEVAHLVHFDHSPRFHALLAELYEGDIGQANKWLKTHGRSLYSPFG